MSEINEPVFQGECIDTGKILQGFGWIKTDLSPQELRDNGLTEQIAILYTRTRLVRCELDSIIQMINGKVGIVVDRMEHLDSFYYRNVAIEYLKKDGLLEDYED